MSYSCQPARGLLTGWPIWILGWMVLTWGSVGCHSPPPADETPDAKLALEFQPSPPRVGSARVTLTLSDEEGKPLEGATLELEGNMNHAGMKPVFATAKDGKNGKYEADLEFTMGGDWFILVEGKLSDGRRLHRKVDVKGVKSR